MSPGLGYFDRREIACNREGLDRGDSGARERSIRDTVMEAAAAGRMRSWAVAMYY